MFKHSKTGYTYYSVNEKINHYKEKLKSKFTTAKQKEYAEMRIAELTGLKTRTFAEPALIVTNDTHFGNKMSKPRLCAVIDADNKGHVYIAPVIKRTTKSIILDNDYERQIGDKRAWVDRSEIYETKYIDGVMPLTNNDKAKIKHILRKK